MRDYFNEVLIECQKNGENPRLDELIDRAIARKERAQRDARLDAICVLSDFVEMAEHALVDADEAGAEGSVISLLRSLKEAASCEVKGHE